MSLKEDLREIDALSDSLRDVERDVYLQSQVKEQLDTTHHELLARKEALLLTLARLRESKAGLKSSIQEKENLLSSSRLLDKVALDEILRLKSTLSFKSKKELEFTSSVRGLSTEMETLLRSGFGPQALEGSSRLKKQMLKSQIGESKALLRTKSGQMKALKEENEEMMRDLSLQRELEVLETDLRDLSSEKGSLERKIRELSASNTISPSASSRRQLNLSVSLEGSTYMKYPKLMDGSSFFKKGYEKKSPERRSSSLMFPNLLGGRLREVNKVRKNISFESPPPIAPPRTDNEEEIPSVRSPYFSPLKETVSSRPATSKVAPQEETEEVEEAMEVIIEEEYVERINDSGDNGNRLNKSRDFNFGGVASNNADKLNKSRDFGDVGSSNVDKLNKSRDFEDINNKMDTLNKSRDFEDINNKMDTLNKSRDLEDVGNKMDTLNKSRDFGETSSSNADKLNKSKDFGDRYSSNADKLNKSRDLGDRYSNNVDTLNKSRDLFFGDVGSSNADKLNKSGGFDFGEGCSNVGDKSGDLSGGDKELNIFWDTQQEDEGDKEQGGGLLFGEDEATGGGGSGFMFGNGGFFSCDKESVNNSFFK